MGTGNRIHIHKHGSRIPNPAPRFANHGFTLIEILVAMAIGALLLGGMFGAVHGALQTRQSFDEGNELATQAEFAMGRMVRAVRGTGRLLLPLADNPATDWTESVREQTVPASPPEGSSLLATAVLAVTLDPTVDRDGDGVADADNDGDGRVDEDPKNDNNLDGAHGIVGIDDDGDGQVDEGAPDPDGLYTDNDEDGTYGEDWQNGIDDDGDGSIDEDLLSDNNKDGLSGIGGVDDDGDGSIDEGNRNDNDEDGVLTDDRFDPVVFFLSGQTLMERTPVPWDENGDAIQDGRDFVESVIAENVTLFRVERRQAGRNVLVKLTLELTGTDGEPLSLQSAVRVGN